MANTDASNGYDYIAEDFMSIRRCANIGAATVQEWSRSVPAGGAVLDIGCGNGFPISKILIDEGFSVYGIDASSRMIAAFRERLPQARAVCESVEDSNLFDRKFDGVLAWGLMFLLSPETQAAVIRKVAAALNPSGRFLFTAPHQECEWLDTLTHRRCVSLGATAYRRILETAGLALVGNYEDEGQNYYYFACNSDDEFAAPGITSIQRR